MYDMITVFTTTSIDELSALSDQLHKAMGYTASDAPASRITDDSVTLNGKDVYFGGVPTTSSIREALRASLAANPSLDVTFVHVPSNAPKSDLTSALAALLQAREL